VSQAGVQDAVVKSYRKLGINLVLGSQPTEVESTGDKSYRVHYRKPKDDSPDAGAPATVDDVDFVLYAIGRVPRTDTLDLAATGVAVKKDGTIPVDDYCNTNADGVYAVGDVLGVADLTPVAIQAGVTPCGAES
jgi:glutathione reductase (NADPH)